MAEEKKQLNIKRMILVGIAALAGAIVALIIGVGIFYLVMFRTYSNQDDGVQISYPRSWLVKEHPAEDVFVAFLAPKDNALDTFTENINLSRYDMSEAPQSTRDYVQVMIDQLLMVFADFKQKEKVFFPVAGQSGYRVVLDIGESDPKVVVIYAFTVGTMGYNLVYIGDPEQYKKQRFSLDLTALSLRVGT